MRSESRGCTPFCSASGFCDAIRSSSVPQTTFVRSVKTQIKRLPHNLFADKRATKSRECVSAACPSKETHAVFFHCGAFLSRQWHAYGIRFLRKKFFKPPWFQSRGKIQEIRYRKLGSTILNPLMEIKTEC